MILIIIVIIMRVTLYLLQPYQNLSLLNHIFLGILHDINGPAVKVQVYKIPSFFKFGFQTVIAGRQVVHCLTFIEIIIKACSY